MNEETHNPGIEPELEARIVALVLGEASDFEREELNRQIEQRPELAAFMLQMQRVHGLLRDIGTGEFEAPDEDWKLQTDRRNAVLEVIRGEATVQPANDLRRRAADVNPLTDHEDTIEIRGLTSPARQSLIADDGVSADVAKNKSPRRLLRNLINVLAVVCVAVATMIYSFSSQERAASEYFYEAEKTTEPRDELLQLKPESTAAASQQLSRSSIVKLNTEPLEQQLFVQSTSGDVDYKKNSATALSALQSTLNAGAMVSTDVGQTDEFQAIAMPAIELPTGIAAEHEVSSPPAADTPSLIAKDATTWMARDAGGRDRSIVGLADSQPTAPSGGNGVLTFPADVNLWNDTSESAPAASVRLRSFAADDGMVMLGELDALAADDAAPSGGEIQRYPRQILMQNEEQPVSEMSLYMDIVAGDVAPPASRPEEPKSEQPKSGQQAGQSEDSSRKSSLGWQASPDAGEKGRSEIGSGEKRAGEKSDELYAGHRFSLEYDFGTSDTKDSNGDADKSPEDRFVGNGRGLSDPAKRNSGFGESGNSGYGGFGGGRDGLGVNQLSDQSGVEMPADENGVADVAGERDSIASFDNSNVTRPSPSNTDANESEAKSKAVDEFWDRENPVAGQEAEPQSTPSNEPMDLDGESTKNAEKYVAGNNAEGFRTKVKADDMPSSGGRALDGRMQENRELYSDLAPAPAALSVPSVVSRATAQPELHSIIDGFNPADDRVIRIWEKDQPLEGRRESGVKGQTHYFFRQGATARPALDDASELKKNLAANRVAPSVGLNETTAAAEAFSTFSLHVSDVSFKLAAAALARGEWPEAAKIRIEGFVNAFDYGDPLPCKGERVACRVEQSIHPFIQQRNLLRVSMRTAAEGRASNTPLRLTFLLDNSGSMERTDRQQTVRRAFALLAQQLTPIDQITLISFARQPRLLAEKVSGAESGQLVKLIVELPSEGGTNIEAALQLAFEKATEQRTPGAQNRIILLTDGAVNLGDADPESLSRMVTTMRDAGIAFDAAGISAEGLNDEVLEALTRKGDGRYYLLDSFEDADESFARQIAGALRPSASNVKVQIEFNPKRVGHYRLLGFEKHILKQEDFRNDAVDAAEMAAAEVGVALYQFEAKPDGEGDVGSVSVRFRDLSTGQMIENRWPIPYEADAPRPDLAAPSLRIATSAALLAAKLRGEPLGEAVDLKALSDLISGLPEHDQNNTRVQQLKLMIEQARQMSRK